MDKIKQFFKDIFTEVDNTTFDVSKVLGASTVVGSLFMQGWDVIVNAVHFSMQDFGMGVGAMFAGLAAVFGFKKDSNADTKH